MSTYGQVISFINERKIPNDIEMAHYYSSISKRSDLMSLRKRYLKARRVYEKNHGIIKNEYFAGAHFLITGDIEGFKDFPR